MQYTRPLAILIEQFQKLPGIGPKSAQRMAFQILKMPKDMQNKYLKTKNWAYGLTFLINTMCIAGAVALLNRIKTKQDFDKENNRDKIS